MKGISPEDLRALLLTVGSHREKRPLSPVEVAQIVGRSLDAGATLQDIAAELHLDGPSMISRFTRLLKLNPDVQHIVDWGESQATIGFTAASELARLPSTSDQAQICEAVLQNGLKTSDVKQIVQLRLRSTSIADCVEQILRQKPQTTRVHVFVGAITSPNAADGLRVMSQNERDALFRMVVSKAFPDLRNFTARLGAARFTITSADSSVSTMTSGPKDFETTLNVALVEVLG